MNPLLQTFERIQVLNLPTRSDRRREMAEQLASIGLTLDEPGVMLFEAFRPSAPAGFRTIGARGCFLSHLAVLRQASEDGVESVLILEDDLNFAPDLRDTLGDRMRVLAQAPFDIFYGGYQIDRPVPPAVGGLARFAPDMPVVTAHCIGLRGDAIGAAAAYLAAMLDRPAGSPDGGPMDVDGAYTWFRREHPSVATYAAVPELGYQRSSRTDIHDLGWHDTLPVVRDVMSGLRRARNVFRNTNPT